MKVAKSVYCTFQQQLQLMPYPDLLRSADSLQKLPNGKIHTAVVREILSSAIAIVCDTCSGVDRVSDNTRLIEEIQIEKDILKLVELSVSRGINIFCRFSHVQSHFKALSAGFQILTRRKPRARDLRAL